MTEPETPPPPPADSAPSSPPPPPAASSGGGDSSNRGLMIILSSIWILALIPLLVEKDDKEVQWHAKHGLVLMATEIAIWIAIVILQAVPGLGLVLGCGLGPIIWVIFLIIRVVCIAKGLQGERFTLPVVSEYADKF